MRLLLRHWVLGAVMNICRGNPAGHEVLVDSWPNFKAVLTRPRKEVATDNSDFYANMHAAFYRDLDAYRALLSSPGAINWAQTFRIHGLQDSVYEASREIAGAKGFQVYPSTYLVYLLPSSSAIPDVRLDPAMRLSNLDVSHVDLLNKTWYYGGNEWSRRYIDMLIRSFPSICFLDAAGHPISWNITDPFGAMSIGYTLPEHRGCGYSSALCFILAQKIQAQGYPIYGNVALDNHPMQRLQQWLGFQRQTNLCRIILHSPVPGNLPAWVLPDF
ncbi:PREDICTED: glycine N-acyltransferase-like protein 3 isoform X2 [Crocodylus porosus]|uniref:glycine N-acyltransferase-like protein 3 isoform X2 n=1 Tax=Crocodylus porosus TaxID=8502 RepID=UPI00093DE623|nr:PREDICTED: glycine N-acyltransferase-like protein 3 isoform X2 [Crocodylus porosus]